MMSREAIIVEPIVGDGYWINPLNPRCPRENCRSPATYKIGWDSVQKKEIWKCYTCGNLFRWKYVRIAKRRQKLIEEMQKIIDEKEAYKKTLDYFFQKDGHNE